LPLQVFPTWTGCESYLGAVVFFRLFPGHCVQRCSGPFVRILLWPRCDVSKSTTFVMDSKAPPPLVSSSFLGASGRCFQVDNQSSFFPAVQTEAQRNVCFHFHFFFSSALDNCISYLISYGCAFACILLHRGPPQFPPLDVWRLISSSRLLSDF